MLLVSSAVLLRNYHLSHLPLHRTPTPTRVPFSLASFSSSLSPSFIFTPLVKQEKEEEEEEVAAIDTTSGVSTYPVPRVSSTFRPNQPPRITSGAVVPGILVLDGSTNLPGTGQTIFDTFPYRNPLKRKSVR